MDETENALLMIADPIQWHWDAHDSTSDKGRWWGSCAKAEYSLYPPEKSSGDVDATVFDVQWSISLYVVDEIDGDDIPVASLERGKVVCARYALTGDGSEMDDLLDAANRAVAPFMKQQKAAMEQLFKPFHRHKTPRLTWTPDDDSALEFSATTPQGTYALHFDLQRRWVVTLTQFENTRNGPCFLTRTIAKLACAFHAHTGQWLGMLPEQP